MFFAESKSAAMRRKVILCVAGSLLFFIALLLGRLFEQLRHHHFEKNRPISCTHASSMSIPQWKLDGEELRKTIEWVDALKWKEKKIFSQNGEDGILEAIFDRIGEGQKYYVEFGMENGNEVNTRFLREQKNWTGLLMDGGHSNPAINLHKEFITASGICGLFEKYKVPRPSIDLLSIDVDFFLSSRIEKYFRMWI